MPIPPPTSGESIHAAALDALVAYLEAETGRSWRGGIFPPSEVDIPVGTVRPYSETPPGTDDAATWQTFQFMLQCRTVDQDVIAATGTMMSWQSEIATSMSRLQRDGISGTYRGLNLVNALQGIRASRIPGSTQSLWTQIAVEAVDKRADLTGQAIVVKLLMNYEIPFGNLEIRKEWLV